MNNVCATEAGGDTDLASLVSLPAAAAERLRARWVTTVQQLIAASATPAGRDGLSRLLTPDHVTLEAVLEEARRIVGDDVFEQLQEARAGGPLGARITEDRRIRGSEQGAAGEDVARAKEGHP